MHAAGRLTKHLTSVISGFCLPLQLKAHLAFKTVAQHESGMAMRF